ncbi:MAG: AAA family ATPase [Acidimicrobiaceae bacterium]|nr:AAA family ATPase [Acidimicrobiaceae bacterium]
MRTPDSKSALPHHVSADGSCIPATLNSLIPDNPDIQAEIVNRLRQLNSDIEDIGVHADDARGQLALRARISGTSNWLYGRSLSDGTLRYIALVLMLVDVRDRALLCIEEPENGIHPSRIQYLVNLLRDYAVDVDERIADDNPLRQVVLNTHSPEVARQFSFEDMIFVERALTNSGPVSVFRPIRNTWRTNAPILDEKAASKPALRQAVVDFIGGSPINPGLLEEQLDFEFGSAMRGVKLLSA